MSQILLVKSIGPYMNSPALTEAVHFLYKTAENRKAVLKETKTGVTQNLDRTAAQNGYNYVQGRYIKVIAYCPTCIYGYTHNFRGEMTDNACQVFC